jgi:hypothetical protein
MAEYTKTQIAEWAKKEAIGALTPDQIDVWKDIKREQGIQDEPFVPLAGPTDNAQEVVQNALNPDGTFLDRAPGMIEDAAKSAVGVTADIGSGMLRASSGAKQLAGEGLGALSGLPDEATDALIDEFITKPEVEREQRFAEARESFTDEEPGFGQFVGEAAVPIPGTRKVTAFGRAVNAMKIGGIGGALEFSESGNAQRATNVLFGVAAGGAFQGVFDIGRNLSKPFNKKASRFDALDSPDLSKKEVHDVLKSAEELGIVITPAEATGDPLLLAAERSLNLNKATRSELRDFLQARHTSLLKDIKALQDTASVDRAGDPQSFLDLKSEVNSIKQDVFSQTLDRGVFDKIMSSSPVLSNQFKAFNRAMKKGKKKLTNEEALAVERFDALRADLGISDALPVTNVGFIDMMMEKMDSFVDVTAKGSKKDFSVISRSRRSISDNLKKEIPGYAEYKMRAQRIKAIEFMQEAIDQIPDLAIQPGTTTAGFYNAVLSKPGTRKELIQLMDSVPGAEKKINSLRNVLGAMLGEQDLANVLNQRLPDLLAEGGTGGAGMLGAAAIRAKKFFTGELDTALMEYITNPAWTQDITKFVVAKDRLRTANNIAAYLARVSNARLDIDKQTMDRIQQSLPDVSSAAQSVL